MSYGCITMSPPGLVCGRRFGVRGLTVNRRSLHERGICVVNDSCMKLVMKIKDKDITT